MLSAHGTYPRIHSEDVSVGLNYFTPFLYVCVRVDDDDECLIWSPDDCKQKYSDLNLKKAPDGFFFSQGCNEKKEHSAVCVRH